VTLYLDAQNARSRQSYQFTITADSREKGNSSP
jgi:hypothetical protein